MLQSVMQRSFAAGELTPALHARADQVKYVTGLRTCRNFVVRREGGVTYRPGLRFVRACKTASATVQLLRYESEVAGESLLIENGNGYFRFYRQGALVTLSSPPAAWSDATEYVIGDLVLYDGVNYYAKADSEDKQPDVETDYWYAMPTGDVLEVPSPFSTHLPYWHQSGRVLTLTHPLVAPYELEYVALTTWILRAITTSPSIAAPTGLAGTAGAAGTRTFGYVVTAAAEETYEESVAGSLYQIPTCAQPTVDKPNVLTWDAVDGAAEYYIYGDPFGNGVFGYLGAATGTTFNDVGAEPDFGVTPPLPRPLFNATNKYPAVSASHQQRRLFGQTAEEPDGVWGSRTGFPSNFAITSPLQDDDAITFRLAGVQYHPVRHLFGLRQLVALTDGGAWTTGEPNQPLTPSNLAAEQQTYLGVSPVKPAIIGNAIIYVQARGATVHDLRFDQQVEGLAGRDLTVFAAHLFERRTIVRLAYQHLPDAIVWVVRDDGVLLGLTYLPEQDVWGWHRHDTRQNTTVGYVEDVCVVAETDADVPYVIVRRWIGGATVRYIERLTGRAVAEATFGADAFRLDSGLSYTGAPATVFTGLDHLEGEVVAVVADGAVVFDGDPTASTAESYRVVDGTIGLAAAATDVHIGLPYTGEIETLDLDVQGANVRDKRKRVASLDVLLEGSSRAFFAGPDATHLRQVRVQAFESDDSAFTGLVSVNLTSSFGEAGRLLIQQSDPLPLTILGILPQVELGG